MKKMRVRTNGIAVDIFFDRETGTEGAQPVVYVHGLPDFPGSSSWTKTIVDSGRVAIQPHLAGSYDSDGTFNPEPIREGLRSVIEAIRADPWEIGPGSEKSFGTLKTGIVAAHSFGALIVTRSADVFDGFAEGFILTSAALHYRAESGLKEDGVANVAKLAWSHPHSYRGIESEAWAEVLTGADSLPVVPLLVVKFAILVYGADDRYFDTKLVTTNAEGIVQKYLRSEKSETRIIEGVGHSSSEIFAKLNLTDILGSND